MLLTVMVVAQAILQDTGAKPNFNKPGGLTRRVTHDRSAGRMAPHLWGHWLMTGDEFFILLITLAAGGNGWWSRLGGALAVPPVHSTRRLRRWLLAGPALGTLVTLFVLRSWASYDVRNAPAYVFFYAAIGLAWSYSGTGWWIGVAAQDDVIERGNRAALVAWTGAVVGSACCFAGANIGDGPGWWCVLWAALLATLGWIASWMLLHALTGIVDHVTIDRDLASGIRALSYLITSGVLWGRGAAGDWTSVEATAMEMAAAWPVFLVLAKAVVTESFLRPTPEQPEGDWIQQGILPALIDLPILYIGLVLAGPLPNAYPIPTAP